MKRWTKYFLSIFMISGISATASAQTNERVCQAVDANTVRCEAGPVIDKEDRQRNFRIEESESNNGTFSSDPLDADYINEDRDDDSHMEYMYEDEGVLDARDDDDEGQSIYRGEGAFEEQGDDSETEYQIEERRTLHPDYKYQDNPEYNEQTDSPEYYYYEDTPENRGDWMKDRDQITF